MEQLKIELSKILEVKNLLKTKDSTYISDTIINNKNITDTTISIVMTCHNRSKQVYYTLKTISQSLHKDIQIILVDDSDSDPVDLEIIKTFPFYIDLLVIKNKFWKNPCVNYNIGFQYIQGSKIIIQNSEVCHVNDVISISNKIKDDEYFVFDVIASPNFKVNATIYLIDNLNYFPAGPNKWYQHYNHRNMCYHFLTVITLNTFKLIEGFSYDYSFLSWYDDDDFIFKIKSQNIKIININSDIEKAGGIHLFHDLGKDTSNKVVRALELFNKKKEYSLKNNRYFEISHGNTVEELNERYNILLNV